ncbi:MAG: baseplate J/gp47 family protein [Patescibacteria group bacterium]|jgi:hypothetical protein|nr:baseplate J/gp47 family protein [Patescibacteria group bacterium]
MKKDVIYIENDDEIAAVVDKVLGAKASVVALVLPKRCTIFHSAVNMKILNKATSSAKKKAVLITSEQALMPIAATTGTYIAKSLQSKPEIPELPTDGDLPEEDIISDEPQIDPNKAVGDLAGLPDDETINIAQDPEKPKEEPAKKSKKDKSKKVPNFNSFRSKLFLGIGIFLLLAVLFYVAAFVLPKANITITVAQQEIPVDFTIKTSPEAEDNPDENVFKLINKTITKAESGQAPATGKLDKGEKATGVISFTISCSNINGTPPTIPSGTGVSTGNLTFITTESASLTSPSFNPCRFSGSAEVVAQNAGGEYNISAGRTFSVAGFSDVTGTNKAGMSGGTSDIVKVVQASDCDALLASLSAKANSDEIKKELFTEFEQAGVVPDESSYKVQTVSTACEPSVDQPAETVTAKATYNFTMNGVNRDPLNQAITKQALEKAGPEQTIVDSGVSKAKLEPESSSSVGTIYRVKTTAITGIKQDEAQLESLILGKNARETTEILQAINGVESVKIDYSPFWVNKTPKDPNDVTIKFVSKDNG